jgi:arsenate reductase (glutaredoxin)
MTAQPVSITIYHNPACGTSRNTLALIRNAATEPTVIEYLKTPPIARPSKTCSSGWECGRESS